MSKNTVQKYIFELADKGFIEIDPTSVITKSGQKRNGSHHYTIWPIQEVVELYHQKYCCIHSIRHRSYQECVHTAAGRIGS